MSFRFPVFLQPRTGQTEQSGTDNSNGQPSTPTPDQPAQPAQPSTTEPVPAPADTGTSATLEVNQQLCEAANRNMLISAAGYDAGALVVGLLTFFILRRKLIGTYGIRLLVAVLLAGVVGALLMGFDPVRADDLVRCLNSADYRRYVFLQEANVARGLVLGLLPTSLLTAIGCWAINKT
ncbi:MAG: hypothetical protein JNK05_09665 [Myxococcales bacterium]|nr:hypothetical protein [Myxococcales bacterium]